MLELVGYISKKKINQCHYKSRSDLASMVLILLQKRIKQLKRANLCDL